MPPEQFKPAQPDDAKSEAIKPGHSSGNALNEFARTTLPELRDALATMAGPGTKAVNALFDTFARNAGQISGDLAVLSTIGFQTLGSDQAQQTGQTLPDNVFAPAKIPSEDYLKANATLISNIDGKQTYQITKGDAKGSTVVKTGADSGYIVSDKKDANGYQTQQLFGQDTNENMTVRVKETEKGWLYEYDSPKGYQAYVSKDGRKGEITSPTDERGGYTVHHFGPEAKYNYSEHVSDGNRIRSPGPATADLSDLPSSAFAPAPLTPLAEDKIKALQTEIASDKKIIDINITSAQSVPLPAGMTTGKETVVGYSNDELVLLKDGKDGLYAKFNQEQAKLAGTDKAGWHYKDPTTGKFVKMPYEDYRFSKHDQTLLVRLDQDHARVYMPDGKGIDGTINAVGTFMPTDAKDMIWRSDNSKVIPHYSTAEADASGKPLATSVTDIKPDGTEQTWRREGDTLVLHGADGKVLADNFVMHANGNVTYTDIKNGQTIVRGDGIVLHTKDGQPHFEFDGEGRFKTVGAYSFEYTGKNNQPCKVTSSAAKEYPPESNPGKTFSFVDELQADGKTWSRSLRDENGITYLNRYGQSGYSLEGQHILSGDGAYRRRDVASADGKDMLVDRTTLADGSETQIKLSDIVMDGLNEAQRQFLTLVNNTRIAAGLRQVRYSHEMEAGAKYNSDLMAADGVNWSAHLAPDSRKHFEIAFDAQPDAYSAFTGFMRSADHRQHIMDPDMQTIAIGISGYSWTARFWKPPPPGAIWG